MSSRRQPNRIRGPHSALTDFLAANNISARQIRDDYENRVRAAQTENNADGNDNEEVEGGEDGEEAESAAQAAAEAAIARNRSRRQQQDAVLKARADKKKKAEKKATKSKKRKSKRGDSEDEDDSDFDITQDMYQKKKALPGQFENCELCEKRFTVTPYSKTGPDGGLVCGACGKDLDKESKGDKSAKKISGPVKRARKVESERMDGIVRYGPKPLVQTCIETMLKFSDSIESFDNTPEHLVTQICRLFTKHRVLNEDTFPLFLRSDMDRLQVYDCGKLKSKDFERIFAEIPKITHLALDNAYQFKDSSMDYMIEKAKNLTDIRIYGANLITSPQWSKFFKARGKKLKTVKLKWLDDSFADEQVADLVAHCPNLERLKLEFCWKLGSDAIDSIAGLRKLKHLSIRIMKPVENENLISMINAIGPRLETLSLRSFKDLDDSVLEAIHNSCTKLKKLRVADNDVATDSGWAALFTDWANIPLEFVDISEVRDIDNQNPEGPEEPIGVAGAGFAALMEHSGEKLRHINVSSCRHIPVETLLEVFALGATFPKLENVDLSFVQHIDDVALAGLFKAAPETLKKVALFGCFGVTTDVIVPHGVVVIGPPRIGVEEDGTMEIWGDTAMDDVPSAVQVAVEAQLGAEDDMDLD
ncbi:RNI-like protein [Microthyrium microscopicum]|uniref:RNI-like protein n=1 Tax=Microthyrium microscopicum TaxID=703497 RepID=A0A6A6U5U1_9PEZI|nr:RNI-like protein [Microthyrium microscopicum]